jgi:undecaprenyl-diphosphatase
LISGVLGFGLLKIVEGMEGSFEMTGKGLTAGVGILLLITGGLQLSVRHSGTKGPEDLGWVDAVLLGAVQGLAALPGLSRSGLTVSAFLLRGYDKAEALRLSFIMSLPIILGSNILLHFAAPQVTLASVAAVGMACLSGMVTIHLLFQLARKINFGIFVLGFGLLTVSAVLL